MDDGNKFFLLYLRSTSIVSQILIYRDKERGISASIARKPHIKYRIVVAVLWARHWKLTSTSIYNWNRSYADSGVEAAKVFALLWPCATGERRHKTSSSRLFFVNGGAFSNVVG